MSPLWKPWQIDYLHTHYGKRPVWQIARKVRHRKALVYQMAWKLGLSRKYAKGERTPPERYVELINEKAAASGVSAVKLFSACNPSPPMRPIIHLKHEVWHDMRSRGESYMSIAEVSGHDHSTVIKAVQKMQRLAQAAG